MINSMNDIRTGATLDLSELVERARYGNWYNGGRDGLFDNPKTVDNALLLIQLENMYYPNLFQIGSDTYTKGVLSEYPTLSSDNPRVKEWFEDGMRSTVLKVLRRMVRDWSIYGRGVLIVQDGELVNVPASDYIRVGRVEMPDSLVGHLIVRPYYQKVEGEALTDPSVHSPNRLQVIRYSELENYNDAAIYEFSGNYGQGVVGRILEETSEANITAFVTVGDATSWYGKAKEAVESATIELCFLHSMSHRAFNKILLVPSSTQSSTSKNNVVGDDAPPDVERRVETYSEQRRPILPVNSADKISIEQIGQDFKADIMQANYDTAMDWFYTASGLPPVAFGINTGKGESGFAREIAMIH